MIQVILNQVISLSMIQVILKIISFSIDLVFLLDDSSYSEQLESSSGKLFPSR